MRAGTGVRKAVIPAGGLGTRMRPLSSVVPKEMLPVNLRPMLEHTVHEARAAGLASVCIVLGPRKRRMVRRYFDLQLQAGCTIHYVTQRQPLGLMHAVGRAAEFIDGEPFAVLLPDNLFPGGAAIAQLLDVEIEADQHVIGLVRLPGTDAAALGRRGPLRLVSVSEAAETHRLEGIGPEKRPVEPGPDGSILVNVGRYVFRPDIFEEIEREMDERIGDDEIGDAGGDEIDDLPILDRLARARRVLAREIRGEYYDVGNPVGYWKANARLSPSTELDANVHRD